MPSRQSKMRASEVRKERKQRQEKFRKRTKSLLKKAKGLARDTDAWVALIVRDRAGCVQSFRSSDSVYWPPSIQDLMSIENSGPHEFLEKHTVSGWKVVPKDESDMALIDSDGDSSDESDPTISAIPIGEEIELDSTILIDQSCVAEAIADSSNVPRDIPNKSVIETIAAEAVEEMESTLLQSKELNLTSVDAGGIEDTPVDVASGSGSPRAESPSKHIELGSGMADDTILDFREPDDMTLDAPQHQNNTTTDVDMDSTSHALEDFLPDMPDEMMAMHAETDPTTLEYDMMDLDILGAKGADPVEVADASKTMMQQHNLPSTGDLGSWQVVNLPKIDPKELLRRWNWVFLNNRYSQ